MSEKDAAPGACAGDTNGDTEAAPMGERHAKAPSAILPGPGCLKTKTARTAARDA